MHYDAQLLQKTAENIMKAVYEGYGKDFTRISWNTPDHIMLAKLTQNVFQFSAAKNYHELHDITHALKDETGNLREFNDFKQAVEDLDYKYNQTWLETEYNTAIGSATTAARWTEFQNDKKYFPILQYQTIGDNKVRPAHAKLNGVKKHADSNFWKTYYPPNGWNCRCETIQCPDAEQPETPDENINPPYVPQMFKTNLAESGLIFPKGHPYYNGVPEKVLRNSAKYLPADACFTTEQVGDNYVHSSLLRHPNIKDIDDDFDRNNKLADFLAKTQKADTWLLPAFDEYQPKLRKNLVTDFIKSFGIDLPELVENGGKSPDAIVKYNNECLLFDFKQTSGSNRSVKNRMLSGNEQAWGIIFECKNNATIASILPKIQKNIGMCKNIQHVWIKEKNTLNMYTRADFKKI